MDERVEEAEDPDGRGHVTNTTPHSQHSSRVVVGLERRAHLALGENDQGVEDFVELAEIENPSVECQTLVPKPAWGLSARQASGSQERVVGGRLPLPEGLVVEETIAKASRSVDSAKTVYSTSPAIGSGGAGNAVLQGIEHTPPRPSGIYSEEDIV